MSEQPTSRRANGAALHIDWTRCDGRGLCVELLDGTLTRDEWGYPRLRAGAAGTPTEPWIPAERLKAAADAVALCPLNALQLRTQ